MATITKDEILALFTSLDSQKKNYLTKQDLENKLQIFNYYTKMHFDRDWEYMDLFETMTYVANIPNQYCNPICNHIIFL